MPLDPRIPEVTNIMGVRMTVYENPRLLASDNLRGCCMHSQGRIEIDPLLCPDQQCETYWHEVLHAVAYAVEVKMDEDEVSRLARGLFQVLRANGLAFGDREILYYQLPSNGATLTADAYVKARQE